MKKGFTLIELLAVIVILAIIALIATPIVLNIINDTKESAALRSADFYVGAVENEIALENMRQGGSFNPSVCEITNSVISCDGKELTIKVDGEKPTSGKIIFEGGIVTDISLVYPSGTITRNNKGELVLEELQEQQLAPGLYDENDNLIASWDELVEKYDIKNVIEIGSSYSMGDILMNYENEAKLVLDKEIKAIADFAFYRCTSLKEIIIPSSVTYIGDEAFVGSGLITITIPSSVTSIGDLAFEGCTNLKNIIIEEGVTNIGELAFSYTGVTSITIPNSVTSTGIGIFSGCKNLKEVTIGNGLTSIDFVMFSGCTSLKEVIIPENVKSIVDEAFAGCTGLTSIVISNSVTSIGANVFESCTSLASINYTGTQTQWNAISKDEDWDYNTPSNKVINYNYKR